MAIVRPLNRPSSSRNGIGRLPYRASTNSVSPGTSATWTLSENGGGNAPALPDDRKGKSGRVLLRRQRDYPAATVVDFPTAVLCCPVRGIGAGSWEPYARGKSPK